MTWTVMSGRLEWPAGTQVDASDLAGCNIEALVQGGHLAPAPQRTPQVPDSPPYKSKKKPVDPVTEDESAEEPEEQE